RDQAVVDTRSQMITRIRTALRSGRTVGCARLHDVETGVISKTTFEVLVANVSAQRETEMILELFCRQFAVSAISHFFVNGHLDVLKHRKPRSATDGDSRRISRHDGLTWIRRHWLSECRNGGQSGRCRHEQKKRKTHDRNPQQQTTTAKYHNSNKNSYARKLRAAQSKASRRPEARRFFI